MLYYTILYVCTFFLFIFLLLCLLNRSYMYTEVRAVWLYTVPSGQSGYGCVFLPDLRVSAHFQSQNPPNSKTMTTAVTTALNLVEPTSLLFSRDAHLFSSILLSHQSFSLIFFTFIYLFVCVCMHAHMCVIMHMDTPMCTYTHTE